MNWIAMIREAAGQDGRETRKVAGINDFNFENYNPDYRTERCLKPEKDLCLLKENPSELQLFLNVPYFLHRHSFAMSDCWGLARLFYAYHGWQFDIEAFYTERNGFINCSGLQLARYLKMAFSRTQKIEELEYGDLLVYGRHVMIYLGNGLILGQAHWNIEIISVSAIYKTDPARFGQWIGYKRRFYCKPYKLTEKDCCVVAINQVHNNYREALADFEIETLRNVYAEILGFRGYSLPSIQKLSDEAEHILKNIVESKQKKK